METAKVLLSGFSDEAAAQKTLDQQFSVVAALGMRHCSLRFVDAGEGIKNVIQLNDLEIERVRHKLEEYQLKPSSLGSPLGKIKLFDFDDRTSTRHVEQDTYLRTEVSRACAVANAVGTRLIRGFSFYPPRGRDPREFLDQAAVRLKEIVAYCANQGLIFGLEVEANLVGQNGWLLNELHQRIDEQALVFVFDGANLAVQGYRPEEIFEQYQVLKPNLGWMHIKDYQTSHPAESSRPQSATGTFVDEDQLQRFVPVHHGHSGYDAILADLRDSWSEIQQALTRRQLPGMFLELEPHLRAGGQFGGFSGPDGFGLALRSLCELLESLRIEHDVLDWTEFQRARQKTLESA